MDGLPPGVSADVSPDELPEGFSTADPTGMDTGRAAGGKAQEAEAKKAAILEQCMTAEARERLSRIKMVKLDKAKQVERMIVSFAMQGKLPGKITEGKLIEMLESLGAQTSST
eukprot:CAMPEP_0116056794 /NCGR_PEP_ID=MMETSP0322-20121206/4228_1 /TAXON_ID=163516 /ORGANISM="Leptocylindrus danicus var. apora, Strain B651" /LENGTH=112 /DNA_ID=CAMNT_0003540683 /DNA_START=91 /DNA_END=425 /DNA_ORIENTATION=+